MQLGIFAKTFAGTDPDQVLGAAAKAGYQAVQYNLACSGIGSLPAQVPLAVVGRIRAAAVTHHVQIAAVSATYNMIHPDLAQRQAGRASFAAIAAQAQAMGTKLLTVCTGSCDAQDQWRHHPDNQSAQAWATMIDEFAALIEIADRHDIFIGVEPELANVVDSALAAHRLIQTCGSPRIRIVLDPANLAERATPFERRQIISNAVELLADHIVMAHAKDRAADGSFAAAGQGVIDFRHFLECLEYVDFSGPIITHGLTEAEAPAVARFLTGLLG